MKLSRDKERRKTEIKGETKKVGICAPKSDLERGKTLGSPPNSEENSQNRGGTLGTGEEQSICHEEIKTEIATNCQCHHHVLPNHKLMSVGVRN